MKAACYICGTDYITGVVIAVAVRYLYVVDGDFLVSVLLLPDDVGQVCLELRETQAALATLRAKLERLEE